MSVTPTGVGLPMGDFQVGIGPTLHALSPALPPPHSAAAIMLEPRGETEDGFERHVGVNFLGHFLLTLLLLPALRSAGRAGRGSRVVSVGSATHWVGEVDARDLHRR